MVLDRKQIIRHYARRWLWIDAIAVFPFELPVIILESAGVFDGGNFPTGVFGMFRLPRLLRLLRVFKKLDVVAAANAQGATATSIMTSLIGQVQGLRASAPGA